MPAENGFLLAAVLDDVIVWFTGRSPATSEETIRADGVQRAVDDQLRRMIDGGLDRAFRLAGLILGDYTEAQDATQEALLNAWRSAESLRDTAGFGAWFDRILINSCRDRLRRRHRVRLIALEAGGTSLVARDPFRAVADRDEVLRAMANLTDDERVVVILHYWDDLTLDAVAARVGWPVGTVKSRLYRALESMRAAIGASGGRD